MQHASNLNMQDEETGFTPLHHAADLKLRRVAGLLLNGKANPHITDNEGLLPLDYAIDCKAPDDKLGELIVRKMKKSRYVSLYKCSLSFTNRSVQAYNYILSSTQFVF